MKTKTRKNALCGLLGMLLSVVCFIPATFTKAKAETPTVATTSLVSKVSGSMSELTVQTPTNSSGASLGQTGLYAPISGTWNKWSYEIKGTFYGDSKIEFVNVASCFDRYTFAVYDLDGNRVLNYVVGPKGTSNGAEGSYSISFVTVESETVKNDTLETWTSYSLKADGTQDKESFEIANNYTDSQYVHQGSNKTEGRTALQDNDVFYPTNVVSGSTADKVQPGYFGLNFGQDSMSVVAKTTLDGGSEKEIVAFDYSEYDSIASLKDGYTVKLHSYYNGTPQYKLLGDGYNSRLPLLLSFNGVALNQATIDLSQANGSVHYEGEYEKEGVAYVNLNKGSELANFAVQKLNYFTSGSYGKFVVSVVDGETLTYDGTFADKETGVYDITVGGKAYKINVVDLMDTTALTSKVKGEGMSEMAVSTQKGQTGLYAEIKNVANNWTYNINGTFNGNSRIDYVNVGSCFDRYTFAIYDLAGNRVLNYAAGGPTGTSNGAEGTYSISYVTLESEKVVNPDNGLITTWTSYSLNTSGAKETETLTITADYDAADNATARTALQNNNVFYPTQAVSTSTDDKVKPGYFGLNFGEESLSVVAYTTLNGGSEQEIVAFDYADYETIANLKDGYQIVMYSYYNGSDAHKFLGDGYNSRLPMLLAINGVKLDSSVVPVEKAEEITYEGEYAENGKNYIELQKGSELSAFNVKTSNTLVQSGYGSFTSLTVATVNASETFADKATGEYEITVSGAKASKVYTVLVYSHGKVLSANLTLSDDIIVNYTVMLDEGYTNPIATFTFNGKSTTVEKYEVVDGKYVFSFTGVTPQYLHKDIDISVKATYEEAEVDVCQKKGFSVRDYCEGMLAKSATDLNMSAEKYAAFQTLIVDLLNYGAAAQTKQNVDVDDLANKNLTVAQQALATAFETPTDKYAKSEGAYEVAVKGASLYLDRKVIVAFIFDFGSLKAEDLTVKLTAGGKTYTYTASSFVSTTINEVEYYEIRFGSALATEFDREIKVQVFSGEQAVSAEATYSVNSYIARHQNDLMKALYSYGKAAETYVAIEE